jgi:hypothetical protein
MKCCDKDLGQGEPYVLIRYWCDTCKTEHLASAEEMTAYIAKLTIQHKGVNNVASGLPDIL